MTKPLRNTHRTEDVYCCRHCTFVKGIAFILAFAAAFAGVLYVTQAHATASALPYTEWKQSDPAWSSVKLSSRTIKSVGCLATSIAMLLEHSCVVTAEDFDPGVFVKTLRKAGGFDSNNNLLWDTITKCYPDFEVVDAWTQLSGSQAEKTKQIMKYLEEGYYIAANVRSGGHWVAVHSADNDAIIMMDPASEETQLFTKYKADGVTRLALLRVKADAVIATPAKIEKWWGFADWDKFWPQDSSFTGILCAITSMAAEVCTAVLQFLGLSEDTVNGILSAAASLFS
ncbi:MAG: hypothetical protein LBR73_05245 [Oscillospiraceae bacterium]|nr:hypothetical protein [Oscillospiraceae bacterium]